MKLKYLFWPLLAVLVLGCNSDDSSDVVPMDSELPVADFIAIGQDFDNVYQYNFNGDIETGELTNLTQELNITTDYLTLREVGDLVSFYFFNQGAFSLIIRDVKTGLFASYSDFFANSPGRSVAWGINNESNVFFGFFGPSGTRNLGVQDVDLQSTDTEDTAIDFDIDFIFQPILFSGKVYFVYRTNMGDYKFTFYDTVDQSVGPILDFGTIPISFLIAESGDLAIVKNGTNATLELYDPNALTLIETHPLQFNTAFSAGPVDGAVFDNGILYYAFPFVQPSEYPAGPASFDTTTQENSLVDLFGIADEVEQDLGQSIGLTVQVYDPIQNVFLLGYEILNQSATGGVLQISVEGELVSNIATTFVPTYFIRN